MAKKVSSSTSSSSASKTKSQRKANLRQRNLGLGIITDEQNTKIHFDSDDELDDNKQADTHNAEYSSIFEEEEEVTNGNKVIISTKDKDHNYKDNDYDDDDDDGPVEVVTASSAKQEVMDLLAAERQGRREEMTLSHKRKRKSKSNNSPTALSTNDDDEEKDNVKTNESEDKDEDNDVDELDEDFLTMVDSERKQRLILQKEHKQKSKMNQHAKLGLSGKHTTFISADDIQLNTVYKKDYNVEVVVLPNTSNSSMSIDDEKSSSHDDNNDYSTRISLSLSSRLGTEPTNAALSFCKGNIIQDSSNLNTNNNTTSSSSSTIKKRKQNDREYEFTRSRAMNFRLVKGKPSASFLVRNKKKFVSS